MLAYISVPLLGMAGLGLFWAIILIIVAKIFHVEENDTIAQVIDLLPGVNCGACGYAGCSDLARSIVEQDQSCELCTVLSIPNRVAVNQLLGRIEDTTRIRKVARLFCQGDLNNAHTRSTYQGNSSCAAEHLIGGSRACTYGCLSWGDCVAVCLFDAIHMTPAGLPEVNTERCTACNKCINKCPRGLIKLVPIDQKVFILCNSLDPVSHARKACKKSCIGCYICVKQDPEIFIRKKNLAVINYDAANQSDGQTIKSAQEKCPQKIIITQI